MRSILTLFALGVVPMAALAQEPMKPEVLAHAQVTEAPYRWAGLVAISSGGFIRGTASGVVVQPHAYATAAHVAYDDERNTWHPPSSVRFAPHHHGSVSGSTGTPTVGFYMWTSYRDRQREETGPEGTSSRDTFNIDFAVGYRVSGPWMRDGSYARSFVDETGDVALMREARQMMIVGYPADRDFVVRSDVGRMHATPIDRYRAWWDGDERDPETLVDSEGVPVALYTVDGVIAYGGNSGGPLFVEGDDGDWYVNGLLISGDDSSYSGIRNLDAGAWEWVVRAAESASATYRLDRVAELTAQTSHRRVDLSWPDTSLSLAGYLVERRHDARFEVLAALGPDARAFTDETVTPGSVYTYRIVPLDAQGNRAPPSAPRRVDVPGLNTRLGAALGAPALAFTTGGDVSAHLGGAEVVTGDAESMELSHIELSLIGPGVLSFQWAVSSEENLDFANPDSPYAGDIYDAFFFYQNDVEVAYLTGEVGLDVSDPRIRTISVGHGAHTFRWEYEKDPYTDEGEDVGYLWNVEWTPQNPQLYFYGAAAVDEQYQRTAWFGYYTIDRLPWTWSPEHGWLYLKKVSDRALWAWDRDPQLGWMYLAAADYPWVYLDGQGWAYYYRETGIDGQQRWFYLADEDRHVRIGGEE